MTLRKRDATLLDGRYRLIERLDQGGMATVWRAYDTRLSRVVAIKLLDGTPPPGVEPSTQQARARMQIEGQALARLNHRHIAAVYDYGTTGDCAYLVMELVEGQPLSRVYAQPATVSWQAAVAACAQVADALAAAHSRGLVHRDVSARNVMLTHDGVKLIDFGLCAVRGEEETEPDGIVYGTPAYMAPERLDGQPVAPAGDIHAVGVLLYYSLSKRLPWVADTPRDLLRAKKEQPPEALPDIEGLPAAVAGSCMRCLSIDPADRPSAEEVARVLHTAAAGTPPLAPLLGGAERTAGTQVIQWATTTGQSAASRRVRRRREGAIVAAALIGGLITWFGTDWLPADQNLPQPALATPAAPATTATVPCSVEYRMTRDTGSAFAATIAVRNVDAPQLTTGRLSFQLTGGQHVNTAPATTWRQLGATITSTPQQAVTYPGGTVRLDLTGRYTGGRPLPTGFTVDGQVCMATVFQTATAVQNDPASGDGEHHGAPKKPGKDDKHR